MLGRIELLDGDERHRVTGEHRRVGAVPIHESGCEHAQSDPSGEGGEDQVSGLREDGSQLRWLP